MTIFALGLPVLLDVRIRDRPVRVCRNDRNYRSRCGRLQDLVAAVVRCENVYGAGLDLTDADNTTGPQIAIEVRQVKKAKVARAIRPLFVILPSPAGPSRIVLTPRQYPCHRESIDCCDGLCQRSAVRRTNTTCHCQ